jgi:AcrR family transcriptional regulator
VGRTQSFETDTVVRAARTLFWQRGYDDAALPDLEAATGLKRSSIYHAFGSKRGLFDAAVESYLDEVVRPRLAPLTAETVAPDALERYLVGLRDALRQAGSLPADNGCLLINTAGSPLARDATVAETVAAYRDELHRAVASGVRAAHPEADDAAVDLLATTCTSLVVAALALTRVDTAAALGSLDGALALVG